MTLGLFKLVATAITGLSGVGAISPFAYTEATRASHKTLGKKTLSGVKPIITCNDNGVNYNVELVVLGGGNESNLGLGFKVYEVEVGFGRNTRSESKKEFGFKDGWKTMDRRNVQLVGNKAGITNGIRGDVKHWEEIRNCKGEESEIEWTNVSKGAALKTLQEINNLNIKITIENCQDYSLSKICDVKIVNEVDLKGKGNYKPKIIYSPF